MVAEYIFGDLDIASQHGGMPDEVESIFRSTIPA
jgi:hypothetical protein